MIIEIQSFVAVLAALTVDFNVETGPIRRELHSSGYGPKIDSCKQGMIDEIKSMGFSMARTHDWALINPGQRVCDWHFIFPLERLDATNPDNYVFGPTDYLLTRAREECDLGIFFRLGTSIEHSGKKVHFNARIPKDFDKVAEVFAGTVRHYNCGWANGYKWGIKYWEIWNEPDGNDSMWCHPEGDELEWQVKTPDDKFRQMRRQDLFVRFFGKCLKRLKDEFGDSIKVGGPAMCSLKAFNGHDNVFYFRKILEECRRIGVKPDFLSWHGYRDDPDSYFEEMKSATALCEEFGFGGCELIINEWHYLGPYDWAGLSSLDPGVQHEIWHGPHGHNGIDSSCFNLSVLTRFQDSPLSQAYYYGCRHTGSWGYKDALNNKYKVYYGLKMFGDFIKAYPKRCEATGENPEGRACVTVIAAKGSEGRGKAFIVSDYVSGATELRVEVKGVAPGERPKVMIHDHERDFAPAEFDFTQGVLKLKKRNADSAAFLVEFM